MPTQPITSNSSTRGLTAKLDVAAAARYNGMQVLSRVLAHAVDPLGKIAGNPCEGIKRLYTGDRSDIIWTESDMAEFKAACSVEFAHVIDLAAHTGLRRGDLIRLSWSHVEDDAIVLRTGKSRQRREVIVPLYDDLRVVLARIPKVSPTVLTNSQRKPWKADAIGNAVRRAKATAKWDNKDLHLHDLRGTAATKFYVAGLSIRVIAEIMGWSEDAVEKIIRKYVGRNAAVRAAIAQLNQTGRRT
jgi:integrase